MKGKDMCPKFHVFSLPGNFSNFDRNVTVTNVKQTDNYNFIKPYKIKN